MSSSIDEKVEKTSLDKASEDQQIETASIDLAHDNIEARIKNPLHGISRTRLIRNVEAFAADKGLEDILPHLQKGAVRE